jgi:glycosyltransferase involved in cell wall biosynthesis
MAADQPRCSVVIRAYNEEKHIGRLLTGIMEQTVRDVQVILVDSGSRDRTVAIASQFPVEVVHIRPQDFTFGYSLNQGIAQARAEVVVMASAHVFPVYPDWLERLLEPFSDPLTAVVYGKQRGAVTSKYSEHQIFKTWFPELSIQRQTTPFSNNANAAVRRPLWEQHAYDERLPGLEDLAWAKWALEQGFSVAYAAEAEVIHVHNETWPGIFNRYRREGMAFKQIYPHETFGLNDLTRLFSGNVWNDWRAAVREGQFLREWLNVIRFRWMQFYGTYLGYRQAGPLTWQLKQTFYYPRSIENGSVDTEKRGVAPIKYES